MDTKPLRRKLLTLAIQGRLVPQDPSDEPAAVLLDRIRAEKARLVKEGKLKKSALSDSVIFRAGDNKYYERSGKAVTCIDDQIPFEIPEGWEWVRLGNISYSVGNKGNQIKTSEIKSVGKFAVVSQGKQLIDGFCDEGNKSINDLPIVMFGDHTRIVKYIDFPFIIGADGTKFVKGVLIDQKFFFYLLKYVSVLLRDRGYARHYALLCSKLLPLPPLAEQRRIVAKVEEVMSVVERYEKAQDELDALCSSLNGRLRRSILQEAIQGRLVPQDPADEPAAVLLDRIRAEKARLVKEGKLKKSALSDSVIFRDGDNKYYERSGKAVTCIDDQIPFEIPEGWEWVRLGSVCTFLSRGKSPKYSETSRQYPVFAQKCNLKEGGISLNQARFLDPSTISKWDDVYKLRNGDVLVNSTGTGTVGRVRLFNENCLGDYPFVVPDSHVSVVRTVDEIASEFVYAYLSSKYIQQYLEDNLAGSTNQKELYIGILENLLLPLPPLAEQRRIVAKVEELFAVLDRIAGKQAVSAIDAHRAAGWHV